MVPPAQRRRRRSALPVAAVAASGVAVVLAACRAADGSAFVPGPRCPPALRPGGPRDASKSQRAAGDEIEDILYPPEMMFEEDEGGTYLREKYPGARSIPAIIWGLILPFTGFGFFFVGISTLIKENGGKYLIDYTGLATKDSIFEMLRPTDKMAFIPQGAFMTFYGFFAFFVITPTLWYLCTTNKGVGNAEFNKKTRTVTITKDEELLKEYRWDEIDKVKLEYYYTALGQREIVLVKTDGEIVNFMETLEDLPRRVLEKKASQLADFLGVELEVSDT